MTETSQRLVHIDGESKQDWNGILSDKFRYTERKHFDSKDMLKTIEGVDLPFLGRKHYTPTYGAASKEKLCLRPFPDVHNRQTVMTAPTIRSKEQFKPTSRPYGHRERRHLDQEGATEMQYKASVRTFDQANKKTQEVGLEKMMGKKKVIDSMEDQRNLLELKALGDKAYKNPEYAPKFYHEGGLIVGSSINKRPVKEIVSKVVQEKNRPKGMTWKERVKREEKAEEEEAVKSLFDWEKTTLKEANPKWRDPDEVEPEAPKKQDTKVDPKNAKKPAGAKK